MRASSRSARRTAPARPTTSAAIGPETAVLLRVHQSNFRVVGFTEQPRARGARAASRARHELPLVDDLGSGALGRRSATSRSARDALAAGADLVCFSRRQAARRAAGGDRRRPRRSRRATAAASAAARAPRRQADARRARRNARLSRPRRARTRSRCSACCASPADGACASGAAGRGSSAATVEETVARVGGGALPLAELPSFACAVEEELAAALARPASRRCRSRPRRPTLLDCRTLADDEVEEVAAAVRADAAHGRDRRSHRPRQDVARAGADREGHRPAAGGAASAGSRSTSATRRSSCRTARRLSLVDVPGHERFVRTMVAGATGIDLFLLVIDAGEGARPQTHEHLAILRLLGVERGVVAVTKADAVDAETLELAVAEAHELVPGSRGRRREREDGRRASTSFAKRSHARPCRLVAQIHKVDPTAALRRPRVHAARHRDGRDRARSGRGRSAPATCCASSRRGATCACEACRCTTATSKRAEAGQRVAVAPPRRRAQRARAAATRSSTPRARSRRATGSTSQLEELAPIPAARAVHHGTAPMPARVVRAGEASPSSGSLRPSSPPAATASCCAPTRRSVAAPCVDPAPPPATPSGSRALRAGSARGERSRVHRCAARRARAWRAGLRGRVARRAPRRARTADRRGRPARPGHRRAPTGLGQETVVAAARARAARLEALPPGCAREPSASERRGRGRSAELRAARARAGEGRGRELARFLEATRPARPRRRRVRDLAALRTRARANSVVGGVRERPARITLARFRDLLGSRRRRAAAARALRRRRRDASRRRRAGWSRRRPSGRTCGRPVGGSGRPGRSVGVLEQPVGSRSA